MQRQAVFLEVATCLIFRFDENNEIISTVTLGSFSHEKLLSVYFPKVNMSLKLLFQEPLDKVDSSFTFCQVVQILCNLFSNGTKKPQDN